MDVAGNIGWVTPTGQRAWSVIEQKHPQPVSAETALAQWADRLEDRGLTWTQSDPHPTELDGREATAIRLVVGADRSTPMNVEIAVAVRGLWTLTRVWQVEPSAETRLRVLRDRLYHHVQWDDPEALVEARASLRVRPNAAKYQADLASAYREVGEVESASEIWNRLLLENPQDRQRWVEWLRLIETWPRRVHDAPEIQRRALEESGHSKVVVAVADSLESRGDSATAEGLLHLAWLQRPGDRTLRHARRSHTMPATLHPDSQLPTDAVFNPVTRTPRPEAEVREWQLAPLTIDAATQYGTLRSATRDSVQQRAVERLSDRDRAALIDLGWLKYGQPTFDDPKDAMQALVSDLKSIQSGADVGWAGPIIVSSVTELPGVWLLALDDLTAEQAADLLVGPS